MMYVCIDTRKKSGEKRRKRESICYILNLGHVVFLSILKCARRDVVQPQQALIRVLDKNVFVILHAADHVDDYEHYFPAIGQVEVHLFGKFAGVVAYYAEDDLAVI